MGILEGSVVADLGAGSGFYTFAAAHAVGKGGKVYAIDVQQDLLAKIKNTAQIQHLLNIEVIHGNIEKLNGTRLKEHSIDSVFVCNVLFQIETQQRSEFLSEIKRILKSNGRVLVVDWSDSFEGMGPQPENVIIEKEVSELFEKNGFTFITRIDAGDHHYGLVYRTS